MSGGPSAHRTLIAALVAAANGPDPMAALCGACAREVGVAGASMMVMADGLPSPLGWSGPVGRRLEDLQQTLGEGPCIDAHASGASVAEPDLRRPGRGRWPAFGPAAVAAGAVSVFSHPLRVGAVRLGAVTLYGVAPGGLTAEQHAAAAVTADVAAHAILAAGSTTSGGMPGLDAEMLTGDVAALHQASGMVSAQLGIGVGDAIMRVRSHAFSSDRPIAAVAADIVARRLRLDD